MLFRSVYLNLVTLPGLDIIDKNPGAILSTSVFITGFLVALQRRLDIKIYFGFMLMVGLVTGFLHGLLVNSHVDGLATTIGVFVMLWFTLVIGVFLVYFLSLIYRGMALRVFGSWVSAAGLLLLGYSIKYHS